MLEIKLIVLLHLVQSNPSPRGRCWIIFESGLISPADYGRGDWARRGEATEAVHAFGSLLLVSIGFPPISSWLNLWKLGESSRNHHHRLRCRMLNHVNWLSSCLKSTGNKSPSLAFKPYLAYDSLLPQSLYGSSTR